LAADTTASASSAQAWLAQHCPSLDGQFVFLDPLWLDTHLLSAGAATVLQEAAAAIDHGDFDRFCADIAELGGWPPGLEALALSLLAHGQDTPGAVRL
jgi:hypothetical protein